MDRRRFVRTTLDVTLLATLAPYCVAEPRTVVASLYDPRFEGAREMALAYGGGSRPQAVSSHFTDLLMELIDQARRSSPARIAGVTTEQIPFCLSGLLRPGAGQLDIHRLDRDLFRWSVVV